MNIRMGRWFLMIVALMALATNSFAQTITVTAVGPACAGGTLNVNYTITGTYATDQTLTAELSDNAGMFGAPISIGTSGLVTTGSGIIVATIPVGTAAATYSVRVTAAPDATISDIATGIVVTADATTPVFDNLLSHTRCQGAVPTTYTATATVGTVSYGLDAVAQAAGNAIDIATGEVTYTAAWVGVSTITATSTGCNGPKTTDFVVTTNPTITAPVFNPGTLAGLCQGAQLITYSAASTGTVAYTTSTLAAGIIDPLSGALNFLAIFTGPITITATATGCGGPLSTDFIVNVSAVIAAPTFTGSPSATLCQNPGTVTYTADAGGAPIQYLVSPAGAGIIDPVTGALAYDPTFVGTATITARANGCGGPKNTDFMVTVAPTIPAPTFTGSPAAALCQAPGTIVYTATSGANPITYSVSPAGAGAIDPVTGSMAYNPAFSGAATITAQATGCGGPKTTNFVVTVTPTVGQPVFAGGLTVARCQGAQTLVYTASTPNSEPITYSVLPVNAGVILPSGALTFDANFSGTATITARATGCGTPKTVDLQVVVRPTVGTPIFPAGNAPTRCQRQVDTVYVASALNADPVINYTLDLTSRNAGNSIGLTTGILSYAAAFSGTSIITATVTGCNGPKSNTFTVTTNPTPVITSASTRQICSGIEDTLIETTTGFTTKFTWTTLSVGGFIAGASSSGTTPGSFRQNLTNISTSAADFVAYSIIPVSAAGCAGPAKTITFQVNPGSAVTNTSTTKTICSGTGTNISLTASAGGSFAWTVDVPAGVTGASPGTSLNSINQTLINSSDVSPAIVTYTVTPLTNGGCNGTPKIFIVTVNPSPTITTPATSAICSGLPTNIALFASTGTSSTFAWPLPTGTAGISGFALGTASGSSAAITQTLSNTSNSTAGTATYIVTPTSGAGCPGVAKTITVTVNAKPAVNSAVTAAVCSGIATNIPLTATTGAGSTFTWAPSGVPGTVTGAATGNSTSIIQTLFNSSNTNPASFNYVITPTSAAGCVGNTTNLLLTVNPAPTYTGTVAVAVCSGVATNIPLTASTGASTTYVWTVPGTNGNINGAVGGNVSSIIQTLTNTNNATPGSVNYTITPTSSLGCIGNPATLTVTVNPAPEVVTAPTATICSGIPVNISLAASTGAGSTFTRTVGTITGTVTGANAGSQSSIGDVLTNGSTTAIGSVKYIVIPRSALGCNGVNDTITVTVNPAPDVTTGTSFTTCSGVPINIPLTTGQGAGSTFTYPTPTGSANIIGATSGSSTSINQLLTNTSDVNSGTVTYVVSPTSAAGCPGSTKTITVTVNPAPSLTTPSFSTICNNNFTSIALTASTTGTSTFAWTVLNATGGVTGATAGNTSLINQRLLNPSDIIPGSVVYRITPTSSVGCIGAAVNVTANVNPSPTVYASSTATICSGLSTNLPLAASTGSGSSFTWSPTAVTGTITGASSGNIASINQVLTNTSNTTPAVLNYTVTPTSSAGCTGPTFTIPVTVNPKPVGTTTTPIVICSNTNANDTLKATVPSTFTWTAPTNIVGNITGGLAGSGGIISQVLTNLDSINGNAGSITYPVTATSNLGGCVSAVQNVTVIVNALPRITSPIVPSFTICNGTATNISIVSNIGSSTFNWTTNPSAQGFITGNFNGVGPVISQTLANSSNSLRDSVLYYVYPTNVSSAVSCVGPSKTIAVYVNPTPVLIPMEDSVCSGLRPNVVLATTTGAGSTFTWTIGTPTGGSVTGQSPASGPVINQQLINNTFTTAGIIPYIVTPTSGAGCVGSAATINVKVNPLPKLTSDLTRVLCSGETLVYPIIASTGTSSRYTYSRWSNSGSIPNVFINNSTSVQTPISETLFTNFTLTPKIAEYYFKLTSPSNCFLDSQVVRVTVNPTPDSAGIGIFPTFMLCSGVTSLNFSAGRLPAPTEVFVWSGVNATTGQLPDSSIRQNALVSFPTAGTNNVVSVTSHVAGFTCQSVPSKRSFTVTQGSGSVNPNVVLFNGNLVCQAANVRRYQWGFDARADLSFTLIPGATAQNYPIPIGGLDLSNNYYWVMVDFEDGCTRKSYFNSPGLAVPGVRASAGYAMKLFPNPALNTLNIEFTDGGSKDLTIELYDLAGKKLRQVDHAGAKTQIAVDDLTPGYYMINCWENGVRVAVSRFIKQ